MAHIVSPAILLCKCSKFRLFHPLYWTLRLLYKIFLDITESQQKRTIEPRHEISNNVVCATSKGSDQPAHTRSLIRAFASRLNIL